MQGVSRVNTANYSVASAVGGGQLTEAQINRLSPTELLNHVRKQVPPNLRGHIVLESTNGGQKVRFRKEYFNFGGEKAGGEFNSKLSDMLISLDNLYGANPSYVKAFDISRGGPSR